MEKNFVPYPLALRLKALGFDEPCFGYYVEGELRGVNLGIEELGGVEPYYQRFGFHTLSNHDIFNSNKIVVTAPTYSQAFTWFREECGIWVTFEYDDCDCVEADICWYVGKCFRYGIGPLFLTNELGDFKTLQEAELACLEKLIELVKE